MQSVQIVLFLVAMATVVATFAGRIRVPAPSLLVVAGVAVGMLPFAEQIHVTPEIVSLVVLPPLLYAAGEELSWRELRRLWRPVTLLAVGLVLVSAAAVGFVTTLLTPLPIALGFVLGAVLASTDPVAVTALGRRLALPPRLQTLVQAESLFNDATSLILFRIATAAAVAGGVAGWSSVAVDFVRLAAGGAVVGAVVAAGVSFVRRRTEDPILESVIALIVPYLGYVLAEAVGASGVTAVIVSAVIIGARQDELTDARIRLQLAAVYGTVIFLLESVVFSLIGLQLPGQIRHLARAERPWVAAVLVVALTLVVVRVAWMVPLTALAQRRGGGRFRPSWPVSAVVSWAGARGVVPLAAALSIPLTTASGQPLPHRGLLVVLATGVIVISLVVQGFTLAPLVRLSGLAVPAGDSQAEYVRARRRLTDVAARHVEQLADLEAAPPAVLHQVRRSLRIQQELDQEQEDLTGTYGQIRREVVAVQAEALARMHAAGEIGEGTYRRLQRRLDRQDLRYIEE
ncbi:Na+/H+ antiporter [Microbispora sp. ATCC PTA-5024]|uniref:Na+/H+ antiporter n=1 Tax=Microbispora sp. ATCC PTA-5024 TaxID=316330 RepID=UPI0003DC22B6|nr:Na+/H+ antiporter [Microbispora sp. ATCC PTA-5024]ETK30521.1 sodium/hydrogen exchanger [Microbispora sp. ATCC PTA-5024]